MCWNVPGVDSWRRRVLEPLPSLEEHFSQNFWHSWNLWRCKAGVLREEEKKEWKGLWEEEGEENEEDTRGRGRLGVFKRMGGARCDQGGVEYKSPENDWQQLVVARWAQKGHPIMVKSRAWKGLDMSRTKHRVNTQGDKRPRCCYRMGPIINYQLEERHTLLQMTTVCRVWPRSAKGNKGPL